MSDDEEKTINLKGLQPQLSLSRDVSQTIRGSVVEQPKFGVLPALRIGEYDDPNVDIAIGPALGEGGMGVVSLARQNALRRDVAVKRIRSDEFDAKSLLHEALMMGMVEHPNVVPVHLVGQDLEDGSPVIVMKRVEGVTWAEIIDDPAKAPSEEVADLDYHLRVLLQLCNAVRFAHSAGVLHLDIKPDNVLLGAFGEVYLADWGIATRIGPGGTPQSGSIRGTPAYMAPEMTRPEEDLVDVRTDVFLLGATLHRAVTGQRLHSAPTATEAIERAHRCESPDFPENVDSELAAITERAVQRDPEDRYQSVEEFQHAVREYLEHRESIQLTDIAADLVESVQQAVENGEEPDPSQVTEARFALRRSLQIWPDSPEADSLRGQLAAAVFEWALAHDDLKEAERAAGWLPEDERTPLVERLDAARERLREEKEALEKLRSLRDQETGRRSRLIIGISAGLLWLGIAAYKGWKRYGVPLEEVDPNYLMSLIPTFALPVALVIAFRRVYGTSEFNRRVILFLCGGMFAVALIRIAGWALDLPAYVATSMEFIMYAMLTFQFGLLVDLRVSVASAILFAVAILAMIFPGLQYVIMTVGFSIFGPYVAWVWSVSGRER